MSLKRALSSKMASFNSSGSRYTSLKEDESEEKMMRDHFRTLFMTLSSDIKIRSQQQVTDPTQLQALKQLLTIRRCAICEVEEVDRVALRCQVREYIRCKQLLEYRIIWTAWHYWNDRSCMQHTYTNRLARSECWDTYTLIQTLCCRINLISQFEFQLNNYLRLEVGCLLEMGAEEMALILNSPNIPICLSLKITKYHFFWYKNC